MSYVYPPPDAPTPAPNPGMDKMGLHARANKLKMHFYRRFEETHGYPCPQKTQDFFVIRSFIGRYPDEAEQIVDALFDIWQGSFRGVVQGTELFSVGADWLVCQLRGNMAEVAKAPSLPSADRLLQTA